MTPAFKQEFITFLQELSEDTVKDETPDDAATLLGNMLLEESLRGPLHLQVMATEENANRLYHYLENTCWFVRKTEQGRNVLRNALRGEIIRAKLEAKRALDTDEEVVVAFAAFHERMQASHSDIPSKPPKLIVAKTIHQEINELLSKKIDEAETKLNKIGYTLFSEPKSPPAQEVVRPVKSDKLTLRQVALLHIYKGKVIPKAADAIAKEYGHQSGAKLYSHYLTVSQRAGRTGEDIEGQKLAPMIKTIKGLIPHLSGPARQQAESELQTLEARK